MKKKLTLVVLILGILSMPFFNGSSGCGGSQTVHLNAPPGGPIPASETDLAPSGLTGNWEVSETTGRIAYDELHINGFEYAFVAVAADQSETTIFDGLFAIHGSDIVFDPSLTTPTTARFVLSGDELTLTFTSMTVTFRRKV